MHSNRVHQKSRERQTGIFDNRPFKQGIVYLSRPSWLSVLIERYVYFSIKFLFNSFGRKYLRYLRNHGVTVEPFDVYVCDVGRASSSVMTYSWTVLDGMKENLTFQDFVTVVNDVNYVKLVGEGI